MKNRFQLIEYYATIKEEDRKHEIVKLEYKITKVDYNFINGHGKERLEVFE